MLIYSFNTSKHRNISTRVAERLPFGDKFVINYNTKREGEQTLARLLASIWAQQWGTPGAIGRLIWFRIVLRHIN